MVLLTIFKKKIHMNLCREKVGNGQKIVNTLENCLIKHMMNLYHEGNKRVCL